MYYNYYRINYSMEWVNVRVSDGIIGVRGLA